MYVEPVATCPYCGGDIPLTFNLDEPLSGIRAVKCPTCGREFNMGYEIEDVYEVAVNEVIRDKLYREGSA